MADINKLKDKIKSTIYPNGKGAINASDHQAMLLDMADGMAETDTKLATLSAEIVEIVGNQLELDSSSLIQGGLINSSNGNLESNVYRTYTDFIPVIEGASVEFSCYGTEASPQGYAFYDIDKQYLSGEAIKNAAVNNIVTIVPNGAAYIRITFVEKTNAAFSTFYFRTILEGKIAEIEGKMTEMEGEITEMEGEITEIEEKVDDSIKPVYEMIGQKSERVILTSEQAENIWWNGTKFNESSTTYNGVIFKIYAGVSIDFLGKRASFYSFANKPTLGSTEQPLSYQNSVLQWVAESSCYLFFQFASLDKISVEFDVNGIGIKKDVSNLENSVISVNALKKLDAFYLGFRRAKEKKSFQWQPFERPIFSLRCDDLGSKVDKVAKIMAERGLPLILAAPANLLNHSVDGITEEADKIGSTRGEICQFVVANGGEIVEHSLATFTEVSQIDSLFVESKLKFMDLGIQVRGAAVANENPSDALRKELEPYLYYYYEYSDGYGLRPPYSYANGNLEGVLDSSINTLEDFKTWVGKVIASASHQTFKFHSFNHITEDELVKIADYVQGLKNDGVIDVMTWSEVYDKYGKFTNL